MNVLNDSVMQPSYDILKNFYKDSAQKVKDQNAILDREIKKYQYKNSANFRKSDYQNNDTYNVISIYTFFFWFYYILAALFCIYVIVTTPYSRMIKGGIVLFFGLFPFLL